MTQRDQRVLPAHPSSVPVARRWVRDRLADWETQDLVDSAELAVSELVTNALMHGEGLVEMTLQIDGAMIHVEVADRNPHVPHRRQHAADAGTGRGLNLLDQTVDRWGVRTRGVGKAVWFELSADHLAPEGRQHDVREPPREAPTEVVRVQLFHMPLLLHWAWIEHVGALLREHLLVSLDDGDVERALRRHSAASDALTLLTAQVPTPELDDDPEALMADAVEPLVSAERLELVVPEDSVPNFEVLEQTLIEALQMAVDGLLLTVPTQPEVQELRRWLCGEVRAQAAGGPPTPWAPSSSDLAAPHMDPVEWNADEVEQSARSLVAADDTNRILAVSSSALKLLGYHDPSGLVGQRLLALIPPRYHQAHLAGFTLHVSKGRSPLLGRAVTVPVLRADGQELLIELTVLAHHLPAGRRLFIAEMTEVDGA